MRSENAARQEDRRNHTRHDLIMPVRVEICGRARHPLHATCYDIAEGGLRLRLTDKIPAGADLKLRLCIFHQQFEIFAQVAWCRPCGLCGYEIGVVLLDGTDALRARIAAQIKAVQDLIDHRRGDGIDLTYHQACREWIERHLDDFPQELQSISIG